MAGDINQIILVGRVTRDAELRYTSTGIAICHFSIAVNRRVKRNEQWTDEVSFFDLTLWEKQAQSLQKYLTKGIQIAVQGELRQDRWEKDGQKLSKVQIYVNSLQLLGSRGEKDTTKSLNEGLTKGFAEKMPQKEMASLSDDFHASDYEDDIPF